MFKLLFLALIALGVYFVVTGVVPEYQECRKNETCQNFQDVSMMRALDKFLSR